MKILVFSDSHGSETSMFYAVRYHKDAKVVIFCGDGHQDIDIIRKKFPDRTYYAVRGNCDWYCDNPVLLTANVGGKKILVSHGHTQMVKSSLDRLIALGHQENADIVLFGHTHRQLTIADSRMLICNPGSIGYHEEYTLIDIDEATGKITAQEYPDHQYGPVIIT